MSCWGWRYCVVSVIPVYKLYHPHLECHVVSEEIGCSKIITGEISIISVVSVLSVAVNWSKNIVRLCFHEWRR